MGVEQPTAAKLVDAFNAMDRRAMLEMADVYDPAIPPSENEEYVRRAKEIRETWLVALGEEMNEIKRNG